MPDGRTHNFSTAVLAASASLVAHHYGFPVEQIAPFAGGIMLGLYLTPDLDVDTGSIANHNARKLGGCLLGAAWEIIWRPYALLVPHRSVISHAPVIGTAIRLGYLALLAWLVATAFHLTGLVPQVTYQPWMLLVFVGLCLSDLLHFFLDTLLHKSAGGKKNVRNRNESRSY